jgi:hypothetical protein
VRKKPMTPAAGSSSGGGMKQEGEMKQELVDASSPASSPLSTANGRDALAGETTAPPPLNGKTPPYRALPLPLQA